MANRSNWMNTHKHMMDAPLRSRLLGCLRQGNRFNTHFPVIVKLKQKPTNARIRSFRQQMGTYDFSMQQKLGIINAISCKASMSCLQKMCETGMVQRIYLNRRVRTTLDVATPDVGTLAVQRSGLTGRGVTIAVLDTGIYPHPDLGNRIIGFKDMINNRQSPYDDNGHGTHVAGCAAGTGSSSTGSRQYIGTAPQANLVGVKVLNRQGSGTTDQVIAGIQWVLANRNRYGIRIMNLSLGGDAVVPSSNDPLCQAVESAVRSGLVVVVAAGNSGPRPGTISTPGISPSAVTVGAANDLNSVQQSDDTIASFSSVGPSIDGLTKPDVVAPGVSIISLRAPGSLIDLQRPGSRVGRWYLSLSGTSMATPIVSGAVAQLLQQNPSLSPSQVKALLKQNAANLGYDRNTQGSGELNVRFLTSTSRSARLTIRSKRARQTRRKTVRK
jgi:serine protease AprX